MQQLAYTTQTAGGKYILGLNHKQRVKHRDVNLLHHHFSIDRVYKLLFRTTTFVHLSSYTY